MLAHVQRVHFTGPEGEVLNLAIQFVNAIAGLVEGILGIGRPDPVVEQIKAMNADITSRMAALSQDVAQAVSTLEHSEINFIIDNAATPLFSYVKFWVKNHHDLRTNVTTQKAFQSYVGSNLAKYRDQWNTLAQCLAGTMPDCIFDDETALSILLKDGQTFPRPAVLVTTIHYYWILLQQSAVAMCGYTLVLLHDVGCTFLPELNSTLASVSAGMKVAVSAMKEEFWKDGIGGGELPPLVKYYVTQNANRGEDGAKAALAAINENLVNATFTDGLQKFFGVTGWGVVMLGDPDNPQDPSGITAGGDWAAFASGWHFNYMGYHTIYLFEGQTPGAYSDTDCRDQGAQDDAKCLNQMHGAGVFTLEPPKHTAFWGYVSQGAYAPRGAVASGSGNDNVRLVVPGYSSAAAQDPSNFWKRA